MTEVLTNAFGDKLTNGDIMQAHDAFTELADLDIDDDDLLYGIGRTLEVLQREAKRIGKHEKNLLKQLAEVDGKGDFIRGADGNYKWKNKGQGVSVYQEKRAAMLEREIPQPLKLHREKLSLLVSASDAKAKHFGVCRWAFDDDLGKKSWDKEQEEKDEKPATRRARAEAKKKEASDG